MPIGADPGAKGRRPGVSPHLSSSRDPTVAGWGDMPKTKMPVGKAVAERYRARMTELRGQRA
eukprot:9642247-Alexandrium_andersonii.AAC.1